MSENPVFQLFPSSDDDAFVDSEDFGFESFDSDDNFSEEEQQPVDKAEDKSPEQMVDEIFEAMKPQRSILKAVVSLCEERKTTDEVDELIDQLSENNRSVYTGELLCDVLERNKVLNRLNEEEELVDPENNTVEPLIITGEDGQEYYQPAPERMYFYVSTAEALAWVAADDPEGRIMQRLDDEEQFKPIYKIILERAAQKDGVAMKELDQELYRAKLLRDANFFPQRFIDKLEEAEAVTWEKNWVITETGRSVLEALKNVDTTLEFVEGEEE